MSDQQYYKWLASAANAAEVPLKEAFEAGYLAGQSSAEQRVKNLEEQYDLVTTELREKIAELERERDEWRIRFGNEEYLRRTEQKIQSVSYLLSDGTPVLMPIISIKTVSDGRFVVVDNPAQAALTALKAQAGDRPTVWFTADGEPLESREYPSTPAAERPDHRAVMEQALEALEDQDYVYPYSHIKEAITALRTALKGEV